MSGGCQRLLSGLARWRGNCKQPQTEGSGCGPGGVCRHSSGLFPSSGGSPALGGRVVAHNHPATFRVTIHLALNAGIGGGGAAGQAFWSGWSRLIGAGSASCQRLGHREGAPSTAEGGAGPLGRELRRRASFSLLHSIADRVTRLSATQRVEELTSFLKGERDRILR